MPGGILTTVCRRIFFDERDFAECIPVGDDLFALGGENVPVLIIAAMDAPVNDVRFYVTACQRFLRRKWYW